MTFHSQSAYTRSAKYGIGICILGRFDSACKRGGLGGIAHCEWIKQLWKVINSHLSNPVSYAPQN